MKSWQVSANVAAPHIKKTLLLDAECSAYYESERIGETRLLFHTVAFRPLTKLPWPLSSIQQHDAQIITKGNPKLSDFTYQYKREQIDKAIEEFLADLPPMALITLIVA